MAIQKKKTVSLEQQPKGRKKKHYIKHPIQNYVRIRDESRKAVERRKKKILAGDEINDFHREKMTFFFQLLSALAILTLLFLLLRSLEA